jgi:phage baseplate assembly protein W
VAISFKSVGELSTDQKFQPKRNELPIGIRTPLTLGQSNDGIFSMHFNIADQIQDNLRNLLLTNWGERLGLYDYGANLRGLAFEITSEQFDIEATRRIKSAVSKWMPFVDLQTYEKQTLGRTSGVDVAEVKLRIIYGVPKLGITNKGLEITFYVGG